MTDDDAIAWSSFNHIRLVTKPTLIGGQQGWRFTILRTDGQPEDPSRAKLNIVIPGSQKPGMATCRNWMGLLRPTSPPTC